MNIFYYCDVGILNLYCWLSSTGWESSGVGHDMTWCSPLSEGEDYRWSSCLSQAKIPNSVLSYWFITTVILQKLQFSGSHQEHNCCLDNAFFPFLPLHLLKLIEWSGYMLLTSLDLISYFIKWEHRFANLSYYQARTFKNYNYIYYHYKSYWNTKEVESFNLRMNNKATIIKFNPRPLSLCLWL